MIKLEKTVCDKHTIYIYTSVYILYENNVHIQIYIYRVSVEASDAIIFQISRYDSI